MSIVKRIAAVLTIIVFCVCAAAHAQMSEKTAEKMSEKQEQILRQKIAQMLIVGFNGQGLNPNNPIYSDVKELGIGGVILFNKNADITRPNLTKNIKDPTQLKRLISDLQKIAKTPLFVAIDQEGGMVSRLSPSYFVVSTYSARDLGAKNDLNLTYSEAKKTAKTLKELGINLNFTPVVDLDVNKNSRVISLLRRSYSADPTVVTNHARQVIKAHDEFGILTTLKHYPGHGSVAADTHAGFADITNTFSEKELIPYKTLNLEGLAHGILVAHVVNKNVDPEFPISLSEIAIRGNLINKMGFKGLIFTDDIQMGAIKNNYTFEIALKQAINARNDVIVIGNNLNYDPEVARRAVDIIFNLVENGEIQQARIDEAYEKINAWKKGWQSSNDNDNRQN